MRRLFFPVVLAIAALSLSSCAGLGALLTGPPAAGAPAQATGQTITPLGGTQVDEHAIKVSFKALELAASFADAALATHVIKAGSPTAIAIADGLDDARDWLNAASALQKVGNAGASDAFDKATKALGAVQTALAGRK